MRLKEAKTLLCLAVIFDICNIIASCNKEEILFCFILNCLSSLQGIFGRVQRVFRCNGEISVRDLGPQCDDWSFLSTPLYQCHRFVSFVCFFCSAKLFQVNILNTSEKQIDLFKNKSKSENLSKRVQQKCLSEQMTNYSFAKTVVNGCIL